MSRRKLADSTKTAYGDVLRRVYGGSEPRFVPHSLDGMPGGTRNMLRAALKDYWRRRDPAVSARLLDAIEPGEPKKRFRVIPGEAGARKFEDAARKHRNTRARAIVLLTLGFGFRVSEVLSLTRAEVERALKVGYLTVVGKGDKPRALPIEKAKDALRAMLKLPAVPPHAMSERPDDELAWTLVGHLLAAPGSLLVTQRHLLARHIKEIAIEAGLATEENADGWSPHMLRHIFTARLSDAGAPPTVIDYALGRTETNATYRDYVHDLKTNPPLATVTGTMLLKYLRPVRL